MYGKDILWGISQGTFEIPHKICYPYIVRYRFYSWWRHQMETFSTLLAICVGNSPLPAKKASDAEL